MNRRQFLKAAGAAIAAGSMAGCGEYNSLSESRYSKKPNFVVIFIDDMGYADIEPFGSKRSRTPHLSKLADEGVKYTQFYNGWTRCSPSRASLMTGCYAGRVGMGVGVCFPDKPKALNPREYTMAEMFKTAGYTTGIFGKWHLGHLRGYLPPSHGFDEYWGIPYSNDMWPRYRKRNNYPPLPFIHNDEAVAIVDTGEDQSLMTRAFTDCALSFIRENHQKPFFAYIPYSAVHAPRFALRDFRERVKPGGRRNYIAQIEEIDAAVGEVIALLRELRIDRNTMVIFMSDNGGTGASEMHPLRGGKSEPVYEGHMRTPCLAWWPGTIPAGKVCDSIGVTVDLLPTFAALCGGELSKNEIDGRDISGLFLAPEDARSPHEVVLYKNEGIRRGRWKLVCVADENGGSRELYDLDSDIGETKNLADKHPDVVNDLAGELEKYRDMLSREKRPNAQMKPCGGLVTDEEASKLPRLADWMKKR